MVAGFGRWKGVDSMGQDHSKPYSLAEVDVHKREYEAVGEGFAWEGTVEVHEEGNVQAIVELVGEMNIDHRFGQKGMDSSLGEEDSQVEKVDVDMSPSNHWYIVQEVGQQEQYLIEKHEVDMHSYKTEDRQSHLLGEKVHHSQKDTAEDGSDMGHPDILDEHTS
eukprot:TRINITY_DN11792_c0_g1::TRINITY_DN11792_c0_g1_i1::g.11600::m.11600 TRINITY_DN11792_c0_g1::TRINITY_DN11792_c0_g1_i1::g.11600  ORF type:complete len:164 (+),score=23.28 TRINITY_DN11792_c0_g1_i1:618-1109(+)